jgi:hypothetical protein
MTCARQAIKNGIRSLIERTVMAISSCKGSLALAADEIQVEQR